MRGAISLPPPRGTNLRRRMEFTFDKIMHEIIKRFLVF